MRGCKSLSLVIFCFVFMDLKGQDSLKILTAQNAVEIALENNYDILISNNNRQIADNNAVPGNAGYLPQVGLDANYNYSSQNTRLEFANPGNPPIDVSNAGTQSINAGVSVNYTLFNGGQRSYTFKKLQNQKSISELAEKQRIESTVNAVMLQYVTLLNFYESREINRESLDLSQKRLERAKLNYTYGNIGKLELLNAEVDLSNDSSNYVQSSIQLNKAKKDLNVILGIEPDSDYNIDTSIAINENLELEYFIETGTENNTEFLRQKALKLNNEFDLKTNNAQKLPNLSLNGGYRYARTDYDANFIQQSENLGWNAGLTLSYNIFDGSRVSRNEQNNRILIENQELEIQKAEDNLKKDIIKAFEDYEGSIALLQLRQSNFRLAQANYSRSLDAFENGQISGIELREAQINLLNSKYALRLEKLKIKQAEISLNYLAGTLISD